MNSGLYSLEATSIDIYSDTQNLLTNVADVPTVSELEARTLPSGDYNSGSSVGLVSVDPTGLNGVLIDGYSLPSAIQIMSSVLAGQITTAGTAEETFLGLDGVTSRVIVTVDASGNRTNVDYV